MRRNEEEDRWTGKRRREKGREGGKKRIGYSRFMLNFTSQNRFRWANSINEQEKKMSTYKTGLPKLGAGCGDPHL